MIENLFGSRTRFKLLRLFLSNPKRSFYVREITRIIDEQIHSVRRELANLVKIGIITDSSLDNRLYYQADTKFKYFEPLSQIFSEHQLEVSSAKVDAVEWQNKFEAVYGVRTVIFAGALVFGSTSQVDLLIAGHQINQEKLHGVVRALEKEANTSLNYTVISDSDLSYRLSINDSFIKDVLQSNYELVLDKGGTIASYKSDKAKES